MDLCRHDRLYLDGLLGHCRQIRPDCWLWVARNFHDFHANAADAEAAKFWERAWFASPGSVLTSILPPPPESPSLELANAIDATVSTLTNCPSPECRSAGLEAWRIARPVFEATASWPFLVVRHVTRLLPTTADTASTNAEAVSLSESLLRKPQTAAIGRFCRGIVLSRNFWLTRVPSDRDEAIALLRNCAIPVSLISFAWDALGKLYSDRALHAPDAGQANRDLLEAFDVFERSWREFGGWDAATQAAVVAVDLSDDEKQRLAAEILVEAVTRRHGRDQIQPIFHLPLDVTERKGSRGLLLELSKLLARHPRLWPVALESLAACFQKDWQPGQIGSPGIWWAALVAEAVDAPAHPDYGDGFTTTDNDGTTFWSADYLSTSTYLRAAPGDAPFPVTVVGTSFRTRAPQTCAYVADGSRARWLARVQSLRGPDGRQLKAADPSLANAISDLILGPPESEKIQAREANRRARIREIRKGVKGLDSYEMLKPTGLLGAAVPEDGICIIPIAAPGRPKSYAVAVGANSMELVPLPETMTWGNWEQARRTWKWAAEATKIPSCRGLASAAQSRILHWLWTGLVTPLAQRRDTDSLKRVWWICPGPLAALPVGVAPALLPTSTGGARSSDPDELKALAQELVVQMSRSGLEVGNGSVFEQCHMGLQSAEQTIGHDRTSGANVQLGKWNDLVPSWIPSIHVLGELRALEAARSEPSAASLRAACAGIGNWPQDQRRLAFLEQAEAEATIVAAKYASHEEVLLGPRATAGEILHQLQQGEWDVLHLALHATADVRQPWATRIEAYDRSVSISQIIDHIGDGRYLAVISSCHSAVGAWDDEQIALTTGMLAAGFTHAIGSLDNVFDRAGRLFMEQLHTQIAAGTAPAKALHETRNWARDKWPSLPCIWAPWVHAGP